MLRWVVVIGAQAQDAHLLCEELRLEWPFSAMACTWENAGALLPHCAVLLLDCRAECADQLAAWQEFQRQYWPYTVAVTALGDFVSETEAIEAGVDDVMIAPFSRARLRLCLDNALRVRSLEEALQTQRRRAYGA
jgi:DNA-binding NtrC family response regulator